MAAMIAPQPARKIKALSHTFDLDVTTVTVPAPEDAEFNDLEGLRDGERHLTWTAGPAAFFMVSAGTGPGYLPAGVEGDVDSDAPAPLAGPGARRIASRESKHRPRRIEEGGRRVPAQTLRQVSDLLFVPGDPVNLRIGLSFEVRLAHIGLCRDDYDTRVQPLQEPVRNEVRAILRGDRDP
jgi:hypothetical protein